MFEFTPARYSLKQTNIIHKVKQIHCIHMKITHSSEKSPQSINEFPTKAKFDQVIY